MKRRTKFEDIYDFDITWLTIAHSQGCCMASYLRSQIERYLCMAVGQHIRLSGIRWISRPETPAAIAIRYYGNRTCVPKQFRFRVNTRGRNLEISMQQGINDRGRTYRLPRAALGWEMMALSYHYLRTWRGFVKPLCLQPHGSCAPQTAPTSCLNRCQTPTVSINWLLLSLNGYRRGNSNSENLVNHAAAMCSVKCGRRHQ